MTQVSVTDWLESHGLPNYGAKGCRCGNHATPAEDCPLHYFMVIVERLEAAVRVLIDDCTRTDANVRNARALLGTRSPVRGNHRCRYS